MKFSEIRRCDACGKPVAGNTRDGNRIDFRRVVLEHHILDLRSLHQRVGLTIMLGGNEPIAGAIGGDTRASVAASARELLVCAPCWEDWCESPFVQAIHQEKGRGLPVPEVRDDDVTLHLGGARPPEPAA